MEKLKKLIIQHEFDFVGLCEVNKEWRRVKQDYTIWNATANWKRSRRVQVSQNSTRPPRNSEFLVGGNASIAFDDLTPRICDQGEDFRKLGRWNYITIAGKNNIKTTIFTCYCPSHGKSPGSVYSQQLTYLSDLKNKVTNTDCPRQLFGMDLKQVLEEKSEAGHQLVVMGDFNSTYDKLSSWMLQVGLIDVHHKKFGRGPITYSRSSDAAIDRIFTSPHLHISKGGFLSFSKLMSDHRGVWIDIPKLLIFGYNPPEIKTYNARKLQLEDPRVKKKYLDNLFNLMSQSKLFLRMEQVHRAATYPLPKWAADTYEEIDKEVCSLMYTAEKNCRKIHAGTIKWSPQYQKACITLEYWLKRRSYLDNTLTNVRQLLVLQKKAGLSYDATLTKEDLNSNIKIAYANKKECKRNAESLSLEYRTQLALAKEKAGETEAATYLRTRNSIENKRRLFRNIRYIEGKLKGGVTSKIEVTNGNVTTEYTDKQNIEANIMKTNEAKYHQTEGGSQLLEEEFTAELGLHGEGPEIKKVLEGTYIPPPSATQATKDFLSACRSDSNINTSSVINRFLRQKKSWTKRKERTCTYNHHIGHFKSIFTDKRLSWFFSSGQIFLKLLDILQNVKEHA